MDDKLFMQGLQNIEDARFIKFKFVLTASANQRWNIVVFEAQRATELTLRGMILLSGFEPPQTHNLEELINFLTHRTSSDPRVLMRFGANVFVPLGGHFFVHMTPKDIRLIEGTISLHMTRASSSISTPFEGVLNLQLEQTGNRLELFINGTSFLTYAPSDEKLKLEKSVAIANAEARVASLRQLKNLAKRLSKQRNQAFYGERQFTEIEAARAAFDMHWALEISRLFYILD